MKIEDLYLKIINNMSDGVYFVDVDRHITFWNKAAETITGYTPAEIIGQSCHNNILQHIDTQGRPLCWLGCPLQASMENFVEYQLREYARLHKPFAVLFMDLDNFGEFNNQYGHDLGDVVLKNIAQSITKNTRKSDLIGRWGGEEFLGIYQIHEPSDAVMLAEQIRILVQNTSVPHTEHLHVTASIGITIVQDNDTMETLIKRADALMYKSKVNGKNCITAEW